MRPAHGHAHASPCTPRGASGHAAERSRSPLPPPSRSQGWFYGPPSPLYSNTGSRPQAQPAWQQPQFVSKYELLWRADRGREWHSLGHFRGNTDATSEVAQSFAGIKGGLRARYLRVVRRSSARLQA